VSKQRPWSKVCKLTIKSRHVNTKEDTVQKKKNKNIENTIKKSNMQANDLSSSVMVKSEYIYIIYIEREKKKEVVQECQKKKHV